MIKLSFISIVSLALANDNSFEKSARSRLRKPATFGRTPNEDIQRLYPGDVLPSHVHQVRKGDELDWRKKMMAEAAEKDD